MPSPERILAPFFVLALQVLLLADVAAHRRRLLDLGRPSVVLEWAVAGVAVLTYLCTVVGDPGFLRARPQPANPSRLRAALGVAAWLLAGGVAFLALLRRGAGVKAGLGGIGGASGTAGGAGNGRDPRDAREARELQPIGRSALDAIGSLEADSDPGEEAIDVADLESAAAVAAPVPSSPPSLGAIPGSPRPGAGRSRAKRREHPPGRWVDAGDPGGDVQGRVVTQSGHRLRFCRVCSMYQPLRTKHCRDCGRCVRTHDHHCPWVGTCVGEGNRVYFYWFLWAQFTELLVFSLEAVFSLTEAGLDLSIWLNKSPLLMLGLAFMGLMLFMVSCLLVFHSYLALTNQTTWENISWHNISYLRSLPPEDGSPFSVSLGANLTAYCCPPWCPAEACVGPDPVKRTEDGWAVWELGDSHTPLNMHGCQCCQCFSAG